MSKPEGPKNLLDRIRGTYKILPLAEETERTFETQEGQISLTARRRKFIMSMPVKNKSTAAKFKSARNKIKGLRLWNKMRSEIQTYGTSSNLFDVYDSYKLHLNLIMKQKKREMKVVPQEVVWPRWIISPDNRIKSVWSILVIVLLMYTFTLTPYLIAFEDIQIGSSWFYCDLTVDCCFFLDIIMTLNSAYLNTEGECVTSRKQIFLKYLKGMLIIDFISVFPFYLFSSDGASARSNVFIRFLRMARLTRIFRASKIINVMKHISTSESMESFVNFLKMYAGVTRLITAIFVVLLITHFTACMWYYSARLDDFNPDTWIVRYNFQNDSKSKQYISALYWSLTTLTTVGYGDISAFTDGERVICMMWMMFGVGFYSFTVGTLSSVLSSMDSKSSMINSKLSLVDLFAKDTQLPQDLLKRISKFVKSQSEVVTLDEKQRHALLMQLPKSLRYEIAMSMHNRAANQIEFFKAQEAAFVGNVVPLLQLTSILDNEFIYLQGDYPEELYFIVVGRVNFVLSQNNTIFKTMVKGSYFGEIELLEQIPREFTTMTEGNCEFLVMNKSLFEVILKEYPKVSESFKAVASTRKVRNLVAQQELADLIEKTEIRKETTLLELAGVQRQIKSHKKDRRSKSMTDIKGITKAPGELLEDMHAAQLGMRIKALRKELLELKSVKLR